VRLLEVEMSARRLHYALAAIALAALFTFAGRTVLRAATPRGTQSNVFSAGPQLSEIDAAGQSRMVLSREIEALQKAPIDSATRSYMAWARAIVEKHNSQVDSATRSYTAWAKAIADQQNAGIDSATRSYMAWAHYEEQHKMLPATVTP